MPANSPGCATEEEEIPAGLDLTEVATAYSDGNFEWKDLANELQRYTYTDFWSTV